MIVAFRSRLSLAALCAAWALAAGCQNRGDAVAQRDRAAADEHASTSASSEHNEAEHVHGEWWCAEHGVPEEICARCDSKLAAEFQRKGDWCREHDRPDSQCFVCRPELEERFAAQYEARYGARPPK